MKQGIPVLFDERVNTHEGMARGADDHLYRTDVPAGAIWFASGLKEGERVPNVCLRFSCPCGCGCIGAIPINKDFNNDVWEWNGSTDRPTLTPSVQMTTKCRWHGYLRYGVWETC